MRTRSIRRGTVEGGDSHSPLHSLGRLYPALWSLVRGENENPEEGYGGENRAEAPHLSREIECSWCSARRGEYL